MERVDPEQEVFGHHAVRRGAGLRTPRSLTQPSHVESIYVTAPPCRGFDAAIPNPAHHVGHPSGNQISRRGDRRGVRRETTRDDATTLAGDKELDVTGKLPKWLGAALAGIVAAGAIAAAASAHVHVDVEGEATAGQPAELVFEVPNERDDAATVSIEVQMPREADLTDVVPAAVEGWGITTTLRDDDVVDTIRWDATGAGLVADASAALAVGVGPLPAVESLTFPTVQTYDDGEVVRWIEPAVAGQPEPELPVPTLAIAAAPPDATTDVTGAPPTVDTDDDDEAPVWPWVFVVIVIAVVGGGVAIAIARRRASG
jgi:uncharacterized protein